MADPATVIDQTPAQKEAVKLVLARMERAERLHKEHRGRWNEMYRRYRPWQEAKRSMIQATSQGERDGVLLDFKRGWGTDLTLPIGYATVETVIPRWIGNSPKMTAKANDEDATDAADAVSKLLNRQQEQIHYESILQPSARRGAIFGLGVQKTYWKELLRTVGMNEPGAQGYQGTRRMIELYRGACAEDVDIFDFFWDPAGRDIRTCEWVIHRTWRSLDYVARMVAKGKATQGKQGWNPALELEKIKGLASNDADQDKDRMDDGMGAEATKRGPMHEVWEYHDRTQVITILDRQVVAQQGANPSYYGELPFQIFRPVPVPGKFVGIGAVEPIVQLIRELEQLRGNRLDAATIALNPPFFYTQGLIEEQNIVFGPGVFVPVLGDPNEIVKQLQIKDVPGSSVQEADELKQDMDRATGVSDPVAGADVSNASQATATGIQLIQNAANVRLKQMGKNLMNELVANAACEFFWLNRQHLHDGATVPTDGPNGQREFTKVTQKDLWQNMDVLPVADSTEPDNQPQQRQDALALWNAVSASPVLDQQKALVHFLREYGIADAESFVDQAAVAQLHGEQQPGGGGVDPQVIGEALVAAGLPEDIVLAAMQQALQSTQQQQAASPGGGQGPPGGPPSNGGPPQQQPQQQPAGRY